MPNRFRDWLRQAEHDLDVARKAKEADTHEWACFAAQQAAEKAIKALHYRFAQEKWGHVLVELFKDLPPEVVVPDQLVEKARVLDNYYIPTRYANSHASGAPFEHYGPIQSNQAITYATEIIEFARAAVA